MAAAGINVVLIETEDQFISIRSVAMGHWPQDWCLCRQQQEEEDANRDPL